MVRRIKIVLGLALCLGFFAAGQAQQPAGKTDSNKLNDKVKEIAGTAEFLRSVPKHFATLEKVDTGKGFVYLALEGGGREQWPLVADAEVKVQGWWGRLSDLTVSDRVWVWFKTDRKKNKVGISMIADEISQQEINGSPWTVVGLGKELEVAKKKTPSKLYKVADGFKLPAGKEIFLQTKGDTVRLAVDRGGLDKLREQQKAALRERWTKEGLPGTIGFVHVFSGEMDLMLDHETMRWARSLHVGDKVTLQADPPIKALVKHVQPWRERTQLRLVVHSFDLADLAAGQRIHLVRTPPPAEIDTAQFPPDLDKPRARQERIDWLLASIYCTCGVRGDRCTGHFYTLASCNPNACGMPNHMRSVLGEMIDKGMKDLQIFEALLKEHGPELLRPHLLP